MNIDGNMRNERKIQEKYGGVSTKDAYLSFQLPHSSKLGTILNSIKQHNPKGFFLFKEKSIRFIAAAI